MATTVACEEWGRRFLEHAVSVERVLDGVNVLADRPIELGPIGVGPGRVAKVTARGRIGTATCVRVATAPDLVFEVMLPVSLQFVLDLTMDKQRYDADLVVPLRITAHTRADLSLLLAVAPPEPAAVSLDLRARGLRAQITSAAAGIDAELRRFVARYVAREIDQPHVVRARTIDVAAAVDRAAASVSPRRAAPTAPATGP